MIKNLQSMLLSPDRKMHTLAATIATPEQFEQALLGLGQTKDLHSYCSRSAEKCSIEWSTSFGDFILWIVIQKDFLVGFSIRVALCDYLVIGDYNPQSDHVVIEAEKALTFTDIMADIKTISDLLADFCAEVQRIFQL